MNLNKSTRTFNYLLLFLVFILQAVDNYCREKALGISIITTLKNAILVIVPIIFLLEMNIIQKKENKKYVFVDEFKNIMLLVLIFAILSFYFMVKNHGFNFVTILGLIKLAMPIVTAFFIINVMDLQDIYRLMTKLLIIMFAAYMFTISNKINIDNILSINWISSNSVFESNFFSPTAMSFCLFFCYFRKNKFYTYLSVLFTIMTFKRIMVIYSLFLLLFGGVISNWKNLPKKVSNLFVVIFFLISYFYIQLMAGNVGDIIYKYFGISVSDFTMGRSYFMRNILKNFTSIGFMSSTINYRTMEMDLPMIYVEMGIISVFVTIYFLTKLSKDNWYNFLIIIFCLLELLTSHWFDITYFWIVAYITIGCVNCKQLDVINFKNSNLKFVWKK